MEKIMNIFQSGELIGTGLDQKIPHGLKNRPSRVIVHPSTINISNRNPKDYTQFVIEGEIVQPNNLRKRDFWPLVITDEHIIVKAVAGKKFKITAFE
jgi:hypothetical protein